MFDKALCCRIQHFSSEVADIALDFVSFSVAHCLSYVCGAYQHYIRILNICVQEVCWPKSPSIPLNRFANLKMRLRTVSPFIVFNQTSYGREN
jgi:hypothetical protein